MKRFLTFLGAFLMAVPMFGQNTLTIFQKDGQQFSYGFIDKPVISYTDNDLVLKTSKTEVQYPLSSLAKFTFTDVQTSVVPVDGSKSDAKLTLDDNVVRIKGTDIYVKCIEPSSEGMKCQYINGSILFFQDYAH